MSYKGRQREIEKRVRERLGRRAVTTAVDPQVSCWSSSFGPLGGGASTKHRVQRVNIFQYTRECPGNSPVGRDVLHLLQHWIFTTFGFRVLSSGGRSQKWILGCFGITDGLWHLLRCFSCLSGQCSWVRYAPSEGMTTFRAVCECECPVWIWHSLILLGVCMN